MAVFAISDLHLPGGRNINKSMDMFGPRWRDHKRRIEASWRAVVGAGDTVVVAGDLSWAMSLEDASCDLHFIDSLPGEKIIIEGNHDYWMPTLSKLNAFFDSENIRTLRVLRGNAFERDGVVICGTRGWFSSEAVQKRAFDTDYEKLSRREAERLRASVESGLALTCGDPSPLRVFLHFPADFGGEVCFPLTEVLRTYHIHRVYFGHIHGTYAYPRTYESRGIEYCGTAADYLEFTPRLVT